MELYPALRAHMGDWTYYIVKMKLHEVAAKVQFGSEVHEDYTLDEAIQRQINDSRVKREIITYLIGRKDRFFSSLVVAAIGGSPKFYPVSIADDPQFEMVADEESIEQSFGVLKFSGNAKYYALDGQHRLKAIQSILTPPKESERVDLPTPDFPNEEVSVLMVIRPPETADEDWLPAFRRLFSSLNRYAKPTDPDTNIIMDEDDVFAILTRRLISAHEFFKAPGRQRASLRVLTKGRPLSEGTSHFTSLQQLYDLNKMLLATHARQNKGWGPGPDVEKVHDVKKFMLFRPPEDYIDDLFDELMLYWDAIIAAIPDLKLEPSKARNHQADGSDGVTADNVLFWPIGQEVMVSVARTLLDERLDSPESPTVEQATAVLAPLGKVDWSLHHVPWRGLLLVYAADTKNPGTGKWKMRNEDRKPGVDASKVLLRWITGLYQPDEKEEIELRARWQARLILPPGEDIENLWNEIVKFRSIAST